MSDNAKSATLVAFDTGPLLCFGYMPGGVRLIRSRYFGRMRWTEAVMGEVAHHAQRRGSNRDNVELSTAAQQWHGPNRNALGEPHRFADRDEVEKMRDLVRAASTRPQTGETDLGESETLLFAQETSSIALIDENAGRKVAADLGISAHCTLDVLVAEWKEERLPRDRLNSMWEQIRASGLDGGAVLPQDKGGLKRWRTPAPR